MLNADVSKQYVLSDEFVMSLITGAYIDIGNILLKFIIDNYRLQPYSKFIYSEYKFKIEDILEEIGDEYDIQDKFVHIKSKNLDNTRFVLSLFNVPILFNKDNEIIIMDENVAFN